MHKGARRLNEGRPLQAVWLDQQVRYEVGYNCDSITVFMEAGPYEWVPWARVKLSEEKAAVRINIGQALMIEEAVSQSDEEGEA